mmetsp:Transcript_34427/g.78483  ORF Transcript_34427/g.78483 Transcript_34427/m.78483 type:complete len:223 (-) Transcript_34427:71-739(-)
MGPLHDRTEQWLQRRAGLDTADVPKVMGGFVGLKYLTTTGLVLVGIRFHPLRRVLLSRREVIPDKAARRRLHTAISAARRNWMSTAVGKWRDTRHKFVTPKMLVWARGKARWKELEEKVKERSREQLARSKELQATWKAWFSKKYWKLADRMEKRFTTSVVARASEVVLQPLGLSAKNLALGFAEGILLAKLLVPVTIPLNLLLAVMAFKWRKSYFAHAAEA